MNTIFRPDEYLASYARYFFILPSFRVRITLVVTQITQVSVDEDQWNSNTRFNENMFSVSYVITIIQGDRQTDRQTYMVKPIDSSFATSHFEPPKKKKKKNKRPKILLKKKKKKNINFKKKKKKKKL